MGTFCYYETMSKLIIIRGNSGSGKSTAAIKLRRELGYGTMLIPQDVVRRDIIRVHDNPNNPAIQLIEDIARYGKEINYDVVVEGILEKEKYGTMLEHLYSTFEKAYAFYFDISFEETLRRHQFKNNKDEFGEKEMREWWREHDVLGFPNEILIPASLTEDEVLTLIIKTINTSPGVQS